MSGIRLMLVVALASLLLGACGTKLFKKDHASQDFAAGVKNYEEGDYAAATESLKDALKDGLSSKSDLVIAHKYLAFIDCVSNREKQCRDEFRKVLEIDPGFDLKPAEAGHPVWGPVFRSEKARLAK
ncbi:MAG: TssQ family T6SS-associated lipoprotein [Nitrosomonadales bacterium]|nr:TssQ family T6SS-associated lipoprotein [Nitrosomonadales bacterium]